MDVLASDKAIDLYAREMERRIEKLEKTVKEKEETIQKQKNRLGLYEVLLLIAVLVIIIMGLIINHALWYTWYI